MPKRTHTIAALAAWAIAATAVPAGAGGKVECTFGEQGTVLSRETTVRLRKKPSVRLVQTRTYDRASEEEVFTSLVERGKQAVLEVRTSVAGDGTVTVTEKFRRGFKGIAQTDMRFAGGMVELTVDGRRVSVQGFGTPAPVLSFDDGAPPPTLRVKRDVARMLRKVQGLGPIACPANAPAMLRDQINDPFANECETCNFVCFLRGEACFAGKIVACAITPLGCGLATVLEFFETGLDCGQALVQCGDGCKVPGHECCREFCGTDCCGGNQRTRDDYVCAGAAADDPGFCCLPEIQCGSKCCGAIYVGDVVEPRTCVDAEKGLCCRAGETACKNSCCAAGSKCDQATGLCCASDTCGIACCPAGQRCRTPSQEFDEIDCIPCAANQSGPVCGNTCCAPNEVCGFGNECCTPDKLCGGACCAPENCLNGTTCCELPDGFQCGGSCCPSLVTTCCNGQCCAGVCVNNAACCPSNRVCGNTCCPAGWRCTNPSAGTCEACPAGQEPCGLDPGNPACCPAGTECCGNGQCCASPTGLCCDFGQGPLCAATCLE